MSRDTRLIRATYFVAWAIFGIVVHQSLLADVIGGAPAGWLRRNSEAYLLLLLVPAFWEIFGRQLDPVDPQRTVGRPTRQSSGPAAWFAAMVVATIVLQTSALSSALSLPQSIITLGESFFAAGVICAYLAWSRGLFSGDRGGAAVVGVRARLVYYLGVALFTLALHQGFVADVFGTSAIDWWKVNAEAYGAMIVVPLWFDIVASRRWPESLTWMAAWACALAAVPLVTSAEILERGAFDGSAVGALSVWLGRTTEAFIAAGVIGLYFWMWRRLPTRPWDAMFGDDADSLSVAPYHFVNAGRSIDESCDAG